MRVHNWRDTVASATLTEQDLKPLLKDGVTSKEGAGAKDFVRVLKHVLETTCRLSMTSFSLPDTSPLLAGWVRMKIGGVWIRVNLSALRGFAHGAAQTSFTEPELDPSLHKLHLHRTLILDLDQEGQGWQACHFLATLPSKGGLGLSFKFDNDYFHRLWNDLRWRMRYSKGRINHSTIQMSVAYNCNYGPWMRGANLGKARSFVLTFLRWFSQQDVNSTPEIQGEPHLVAEWMLLSAKASMDSGGRESLPDVSDDQELSDLFLKQIAGANNSFRVKGQYCKMSAWFSIFGPAQDHDEKWTSWRFMSFWMAKLLQGPDRFCAKVQNKVARDMLEIEERGDAITAQEQKQEITKLRRHTGNVMTLVPFLLHNHNLFNMRLLLLAGRPMWDAYTATAAAKKTAEQSLEFASRLATGSEEACIRTVWRVTLCNAQSLNRLGVPIPGGKCYPMGPEDLGNGLGNAPGVPADQMPDRIMSFVLHITEGRLKTSHQWTLGLPESFAGVLWLGGPQQGFAHGAPQTGRNSFQRLERLWRMVNDIESRAN